MRIIEAVRRLAPDTRDGLVGTRANSAHYDELVTEPCHVTVDGKTLIKVVDLPDAEELCSAVRRVKHQQTARTNGLVSTSRVFGFQPRVTLRRDFCGTAGLAREQPYEHGVVCAWAKRAEQLYEAEWPERLAVHRRVVAEGVKPCWRIHDTVFTSGICNRENPLAYHRDTSNFKNTASVMFVFSHECSGGALVLPEYRLAFDVRPAAAFIFDGQHELHGVTMVRRARRDAYRHSIVYYSLTGMCHCGTAAEELTRIRAVRTQREKKRAGL